MTNDQAAVPDLVVTGGHVFDPGSGIDRPAEVGVRRGQIVAIDSELRRVGRRMEYPPSLGTQVLDAGGAVVVPGLIDLHAHVYTGVCPLTVPADDACRQAGVTTVVSAGDAGANTIGGFRQLVVQRNRTRILAFLHISTIGLASWPVGESIDLGMLDVEAAVDAVEKNRDIVVGIKVRETAPDVVGDNGLEPLRRALQVGERTNLPVMCHIGNTPEHLDHVLEMLRPGDVLTHCFTGSANNLLDSGKLVGQALAARDRGVVFDIGHGFGSFDFSIAEAAFREGLMPTTISTDLHSLSASSTMRDLPTTMTKLLALGMPLADVIVAATSRPAVVIGRPDLGRIAVGGPADLALISVVEGDAELGDAFGNVRRTNRTLVARATVRAGVPWDGPYPHPGPTFGTPVPE